MKPRPYEKVAVIYDAMMKRLDYESWSNYILEIADEYIDENATVLELGAGSCKIAGYISAKYKNYYATDISLSMLKSSGNIDLPKICCDMTELPLKTKFDFIFSNFDGVNYILRRLPRRPCRSPTIALDRWAEMSIPISLRTWIACGRTKAGVDPADETVTDGGARNRATPSASWLRAEV